MKSIAALSLPLIFAFSINVLASKVNAQIKPDQTLGNESSILQTVLQNTTVAGGARRGNNVFHSFKELSIDAAQRLDFLSPVGVTNIITRVTDTPSKIDGTLGVTGNANLFLINPNGIYFGSGARLDMAGTFIGSTANDIRFADGSIFGVTSTTTPLLTMSTPIGLQFGRTQGGINLKDARNLATRSSLILVGGNISIDRSTVLVPGGKIELVAVGEQGLATIDWQKITSPRETSVNAGANRADIVVGNASILKTDNSNQPNGAISLQGRNIEISDPGSDGTLILARSSASNGSEKGGSIILDATNNIVIVGNSGASTRPGINSSINGGDIFVTAKNLDILDGSFLATGANAGSSGNGGDIKIKVSDTVTIAAPRNTMTPGQFEDTQISTGQRGSAHGSGGNISIEARRLIHRDGAQIFTDNSGSDNSNSFGKLGNIQIVASELVQISGVSSSERIFGFFKPTGITSFTDSWKDAGDINIQTPRFILQDGAVISAGTDRGGTGGKILITGLGGSNAQSVELVGNSGLGRALGIENSPGFAGIGNGSRIRSITSSDSNAGGVMIKSDRIVLEAGTRIDVGTLTGMGNGGSIDIQSKTLELTEGGQLISTTRGGGQAGNIQVTADRVVLNGIDQSFKNRQAFFGLIIAANAQMDGSPSVFRIALDNFLNKPSSEGKESLLSLMNPADRSILTKYLTLLEKDDGARRSLQAFLLPKTQLEISPAPVNLFLNSSENSGIVTRSLDQATGGGGNINFNGTQLLLLRNQGIISASAATNSPGGNVNIQAPLGAVVAVPNENSDISASALNGSGGMVNVNALNVIGFSTQVNDKFSNIIATSTGGPQGVVTINTLGSDPDQGLKPKPIEPGKPDIAQDCRAVGNTQVSKLTNSGKGGLTPNPNDLLTSANIWTDPAGTKVANQPTGVIIEARGWVNGQGKTVVLTSQANPGSNIPANTTARNCYVK